MAKVDVRALLHELQVHQSELEMQNEELLRAQRALQEGPISITTFSTSPRSATSGWTRRAGFWRSIWLGRRVGLDRSTAATQRFGQYLTAQSRVRFAEVLRDVLQADRRHECEIELQEDGKLLYVVGDGVPAHDGGANDSLRVVVTDITDRKRAEQETARLASFPMLNPQPIVEADMDKGTCFVNPAAKRLFPDIQQLGRDHPWLSQWDLLAKRFRESGERFARDVTVGERHYHQVMYYVPEARRVRIFGEDITDRVRLEDARKFLLQCGYAGSGEDFFQSLARLPRPRVWEWTTSASIGLLGDELQAQTVAVYNDGKFDDNVTYALKDTPCGEVVGKTICCFPKDVCQLFPKDAALQELKAESYVGTTLWSFDGKPIGLIAVIGRKPLANPSLAESMLKLVAIRAAGELERRQAERPAPATERGTGTARRRTDRRAPKDLRGGQGRAAAALRLAGDAAGVRGAAVGGLSRAVCQPLLPGAVWRIPAAGAASSACSSARSLARTASRSRC